MSRQARFEQRRTCEACGEPYWAARSDSRTCGETCKKRLQRGSKYALVKGLDNAGGVKYTRRPLAGAVPVMAAGTAAEDLRSQWPQGLEVKCALGRFVKPGRVDWNGCPRLMVLRSTSEVPVNMGFTWERFPPAKLTPMRRF